jgi:hypothetical protein
MLRLMRLLDRPDSIPLLRPGIMRELHYWLLSGQHGDAMRSLCDPASHASRLAAEIGEHEQTHRFVVVTSTTRTAETDVELVAVVETNPATGQAGKCS